MSQELDAFRAVSPEKPLTGCMFSSGGAATLAEQAVVLLAARFHLVPPWMRKGDPWGTSACVGPSGWALNALLLMDIAMRPSIMSQGGCSSPRRSCGASLPRLPWVRGHANVSWYIATEPDGGSVPTRVETARIGIYFVLDVLAYYGNDSCLA